MSEHAVAMKDDLGVDLPAHQETYNAFVGLTENLTVHILNIVLLLVLWGLEGHGFVALFGFVLNIAATAVGGMTGLGWRPAAGVFVLLAIAAIVL